MQVERKRRFIELNDLYIECGELTKEIGKFYMEDLRDAITKHRKYGKEKIWIAVNFRKNSLDKKKMHLKMLILDFPLKKMRESFDLWEFDYHKEELKPLWSLPHLLEMRNYLKDESKYSPELIKWIHQYLKQEGINLKKLKLQKTN